MRNIVATFILVAALAFAAYRLFGGTTSGGDTALSPYLVGEMAPLVEVSEARGLPDHIVARADGSPIALKDMAGKAMLINLWASWCIPCRAEMPELENLQKILGDEDFEVVAINVDRGGHKMAAEILEEWGVPGLAVYAEPTAQIAFDLAGGALPTSLIVDKKGMVKAYYLGPLKWDRPEAIALFEALKAGKI